MPAYVELHARSAFSFLEGASVPEQLIAACAAHEMPAMSLLDRDGLYGAARFHLAAKKVGIKAHIGAEITVKVQGPTSNVPGRRQDFGLWTLDFGQSVITIPVLARTRTGYQNLCRLITLMKLRVPKHAKPGECAVTPAELAAHAEGLICLTGGADGPLAGDWDKEKIRDIADWLVDTFGKGNVYAELQRHFNRDEAGHQWRLLCQSVSAGSRGCLHLSKKPRAAGKCRQITGWKFRNVSETAKDNDRDFCGFARSNCKHTRAFIPPGIYSRRSWLRISQISRSGRPDNGFVPAPTH